jgi:flagellar protein FlbT
MALKVSLKPGEQFVVNGAVVRNGDRRTNLILQNKVSLLREKDIMQEDEANTPSRRIYFAIMLMYLDQDNFHSYYDEFVLRMTEFMNAIEDSTATQNCLSISRDVMHKEYYRALVTCRKLFDFEAERLNYVPAA